ncbi:polysaccharide pyruvyl transferase family protein [Nitratireductor aquimarinus]|uniref:Polysaccharide pyruvyl transferase family protein n=1 Tax=Nitratireductor aquimarinus TaxID=889300 RepID=A0ABU4AL73_9HYPH|nr:polysaccharide pyruvyl transferase family protein [Nitratireductor aquimarinus]MDV6226988.1 polysaccharide pyruvyl transferase family protein [Nitratireductor aquimarinus]
MREIKLNWWRELSGQNNFGDDLPPILIERLTGKKVTFSKLKKCDMISTGSILDLAVKFTKERILRRPFHRTLVWGSGSFGTVKPGYHHLKVSAVRGPLTRQALGLSDNVTVGDPALLLPRIIDRPHKKYRWGIIPHIAHQSDPVVADMALQPGSRVIDLARSEPLEIAEEIASCDFVISSSLHGLITADAFGIPNLWMQIGKPLVGGQWKFRDYFESINRTGNSVQSSVFLKQYEEKAERPDNRLIEKISDKLITTLPR